MYDFVAGFAKQAGLLGDVHQAIVEGGDDTERISIERDGRVLLTRRSGGDPQVVSELGAQPDVALGKSASLAGSVGGFLKKHPRVGIGLGAAAVGGAIGVGLGYQAHKQTKMTGNLAPGALQEQFRRRQMDRTGSY